MKLRWYSWQLAQVIKGKLNPKKQIFNRPFSLTQLMTMNSGAMKWYGLKN